MDIKILYEDKDIVAVVKPRGLLSEMGDSRESLPAALAERCGTLFPIHRLDRTVGGVMVYARHKKAAAALSRAVTENALTKEYIAVVEGIPAPPSGEWRDLLLKDARQNKSFVVDSPRKGAKEAILRYRTEATVNTPEGPLSKVHITLVTGRSHQIRVQFATRRHPLVGDGKYGSRRKAAGPALFAMGLAFPHPASGEALHFASPLPADPPFDLFGSAGMEIERKLLIAMPDREALVALDGCRVKAMVQTYLQAPAGETHRVRRVAEKGAVRYVETRKRRVSALAAVEEERDLTEQEYEALLSLADPTRRPIEKTRYAFPFAEHTVEIDVYPFWQDRAVLEVELEREDETFDLPAFLHIYKDVTADKRYKNVNLAREIPVEDIPFK